MDGSFLLLLPFPLLLACMAIAPQAAPKWWDRHYGIVAAVLSAPVAGWYIFHPSQWHNLVHLLGEYAQFIILIGSLFVVSSGIHLRWPGRGRPLSNTGFLLMGAFLANIMGTTGASLLLIRPWLRFNKSRAAAHHVIFFIFLVSNIGGALTPIGDPPLFVGYLKGIPFWWTFQHCFQSWMLTVGCLLAIFYFIDRRQERNAPPVAEKPTTDTFSVTGLENLIYLGCIVGSLFVPEKFFLREGIMIAAAALSFFRTSREIHQANQFHWKPIAEVAVQFAGLFATMAPVLPWINAHLASAKELSPAAIFWLSGASSSILDNAPTFYMFFQTLMASTPDASVNYLLNDPAGVEALAALSVASVFFGAATYIGNGPNFLVKSISEQHGIRLPGFFGYVLRFSIPCLLPVFVLVWRLFFR